MQIKDLEITYLNHSGFRVDQKDRTFIFDYFPENGVGYLNPETLRGRDVVVFSSHRHHDHYTPEIFSWEDSAKTITWILSDDIPAVPGRGRVFVRPGKTYAAGDICIRTLESTDEGAAFLVKSGEKVIYHAGDLNWWHWTDESDAYNLDMEQRYKHQIELLKGEKIDVAFLPLDPRQEQNYILGMDWFLRHVCTDFVFPMHFWGRREVFDWLRQDARAQDWIQKVVFF